MKLQYLLLVSIVINQVKCTTITSRRFNFFSFPIVLPYMYLQRGENQLHLDRERETPSSFIPEISHLKMSTSSFKHRYFYANCTSVWTRLLMGHDISQTA